MDTRLPKVVWKILLFSSAVTGALMMSFNLPALPAMGSPNQNHPPELPVVHQAATSTPTEVPEKPVYLPVVQSRHSFIELAYISDTKGAASARFFLGDLIQYSVRGINHTGIPVSVRLQWSLSGPCQSGVVHTETVTVNPGPWIAFHEATAPNCTGRFTSTVQVTYLSEQTNLSTQFTIHDLSVNTYSDKPAFDKCNVPTSSQLQTWWDNSPYYTVNLYIGGISRGCHNQELTAELVASAANMGWSFIPTWVGPQAPCAGSRYKNKMTRSLSAAYQQGWDEAMAAADAAEDLGLLLNNPIYYDLEAYNDNDPGMTLATCRNIIKEFMRGWTAGLHNRNMISGVYGTPCTSFLSDFDTINPKPDDVWIARWTKTTYTEGMTVWGMPCGLTDDLWSNHQRILQYAGDHVETWGGVRMSLDSNIADGDVSVLPRLVIKPTAIPTPTASPTPSPTPDGGTASYPEALVTSSEPDSYLSAFSEQTFGLISEREGWALSGGRLLWTADGGVNWSDLTPALDGELLGAYFLNQEQGWVAARGAFGDRLLLLRTEDGGASWAKVEVEPDGPFEKVFLQFVDSQNGWAAVKLASSNAFSLGVLYRTTDGGRTWMVSELPGGHAVRFANPVLGWTAAGAEGASLYITYDGGKTWRPQVQENGLPFNLQAMAASAVALPEGTIQHQFLDAQTGWAEVFEGTCSGDKVPTWESSPGGAEPFRCQARTRLLRTVDGGRSWVEITP